MASNINDNIDVTLPAEQTGGYAGKVLKTKFVETLTSLKSGLTVAKSEITALQDGGIDAESVQDIIASTLVAGSNVTITYNDTLGTITIASTASGGGDTAQNVSFAGASLPSDIALGNVINVADLTGNLIIPDFTNPTITKLITVLCAQDATGGRNLTVAGLDLGAGLSGQKITIMLRYDNTDYRLVNQPVWS